MCGRFTLAKELGIIIKRFNVTSEGQLALKPSYNIPPTAVVPIILENSQGRYIEYARWGLAREWAPQITNLQQEKVVKGPFKTLLAKQRCIVPADGFYEWGTRGKKKYPVWFSLATKGLFGFPGLYDEGEIKRFTIFTTTPNSVVAKVHDRMPVILLKENEDKWLNANVTDLSELHSLLTQYPAEAMFGHEVSTAVSYARNNSPDLINPLE